MTDAIVIAAKRDGVVSASTADSPARARAASRKSSARRTSRARSHPEQSRPAQYGKVPQELLRLYESNEDETAETERPGVVVARCARLRLWCWFVSAPQMRRLGKSPRNSNVTSNSNQNASHKDRINPH